MWDLKSCDNIQPNESLHVLISNIREGLYFDPISEVICFDEKPSLVSNRLRERSKYIQSPLCKRPWAGKRLEYPFQLMNI